MGMRRIVITWLVLLLTTLMFGALTMRLISREQRRLGEAAEVTARRQLEAAATQIELTIQGIEQGIMDQLLLLPTDTLTESLLQVERANPLVAHSYVWTHNREVLHPRLGKAQDPERAAFLQRYESLFDGSVEWMAPSAELDLAPRDSAGSFDEPPNQSVQAVEAAYRGTKRSLGQDGSGTERDHRWISWYDQDQLYLLAVVEDAAEGLVFGVELETIALLSRLHAAMPPAPKGAVVALRDRHGTIIHRSGEPPGDAGGGTGAPPPEIAVPVGSLLPTYELTGAGLRGVSHQADRLFVWLSWLQLAAFMLAIMGAGLLLLWQANRNLRDARQKTGFVSNVSHELKTPLTTIRMYAELLGENRVKDPDKRRTYLGVIVNESQRLTRLVNNVLDFSRLEQQRRSFEFGTLDLVAFVRGLVDTQTHCRRPGDSPFAFRTELERCEVRAEADAVEQIVLNILDNACKYADSDSGVDLELEADAVAAHLHIMDRGPGVPAAHRRKIFDKFHRVDDSLTSGRAGSGLGLSIARGLATGMDGALRYRERPGGGCDFILSLPLAAPPPHPETA